MPPTVGAGNEFHVRADECALTTIYAWRGCRTISKRRLEIRILRKSSLRGMILRMVER